MNEIQDPVPDEQPSDEGQMSVEDAILLLQDNDAAQDDGASGDPEAEAAVAPVPNAEFMRVLVAGNEKNAPLLITNGEASMLVPFNKETVVPRAIFIALKDSAVQFEHKPL